MGAGNGAVCTTPFWKTICARDCALWESGVAVMTEQGEADRNVGLGLCYQTLLSIACPRRQGFDTIKSEMGWLNSDRKSSSKFAFRLLEGKSGRMTQSILYQNAWSIVGVVRAQ